MTRFEKVELGVFLQGAGQSTAQNGHVFSPAPKSLAKNEATYNLQLAPQQKADFYISISCLTP